MPGLQLSRQDAQYLRQLLQSSRKSPCNNLNCSSRQQKFKLLGAGPAESLVLFVASEALVGAAAGGTTILIDIGASCGLSQGSAKSLL